uniref:SH3 domain-containing protein n=1 Tax=Poecilia reticulata TaxID=8081 RepID=A0A3P9NZ38_POERE
MLLCSGGNIRLLLFFLGFISLCLFILVAPHLKLLNSHKSYWLTTLAYVAQQPDEMSVEKADIILVHQDNWIQGTRLSDQHFGWVPNSHLQVISNDKSLNYAEVDSFWKIRGKLGSRFCIALYRGVKVKVAKFR